jgi:hypothetical protein
MFGRAPAIGGAALFAFKGPQIRIKKRFDAANKPWYNAAGAIPKIKGIYDYIPMPRFTISGKLHVK